MILSYNDETHTYSVDGIVKPSVTQILGNVGVRKVGGDGKKYWSPIGFDDRFVDDSGNSSLFGKHFHAYAAMHLRGEDCDYDPAMQPWVSGFKKFLSHNPYLLEDAELKLVEVPLYSEKYEYAGTPDLFILCKKGAFLLDWKTGAFQYSSFLQTAAYAQLIEENFNMPATKIHRVPVQIMQETYKAHSRFRKPEDWNHFLSILNTYQMAA